MVLSNVNYLFCIQLKNFCLTRIGDWERRVVGEEEIIELGRKEDSGDGGSDQQQLNLAREKMMILQDEVEKKKKEKGNRNSC